MSRVAAIIPAYNEENTIGQVLDVVLACELVDRVYVISDGSSDRTVEKAMLHEEVQVIEMLQNRGKGAAVKAGLDHSDQEVLLILDADLIGLTDAHIRSLLKPVLNAEAAMSIGQFEMGRVVTDIAQKVAPFLSGQRALQRELLESVSDLDLLRFGIEVALHRHVEDKGIPVELVLLPDLSHVMKEEKLGLLKGAYARLKMYRDIVKYALKNNPNQDR